MQVFGRCQLGSGVTLEAQHGVVGCHPGAVVNDLDEGATGILHDHLDVRGAGVHGILHQLFHHGSGALDHLSRGNHVCNILGQDPQFHYSNSKNLAMKMSTATMSISVTMVMMVWAVFMEVRVFW